MKAQAAMEFLMTYGWAILVTITAVVAFLYFTDIQGGGDLGDGLCLLTGDFTCPTFVLRNDASNPNIGFFEVELLAFRNAELKGVEIVPNSNSEIKFTNPGSGLAYYQTGNNPPFGSFSPLSSANSASWVDIQNGQKYVVKVFMFSPDAPLQSGQRLDGTITITYTIDGSTIEKKLSGDLKKIKVE